MNQRSAPAAGATGNVILVAHSNLVCRRVSIEIQDVSSWRQSTHARKSKVLTVSFQLAMPRNKVLASDEMIAMVKNFISQVYRIVKVFTKMVACGAL